MSEQLARDVLASADRYALLSVGSDVPITAETDENVVKKQCERYIEN